MMSWRVTVHVVVCYIKYGISFTQCVPMNLILKDILAEVDLHLKWFIETKKENLNKHDC